MISGCADSCKIMLFAKKAYRRTESKASIHSICHVAEISKETVCSTLQHVTACFEHVIDINGMHIEKIATVK